MDYNVMFFLLFLLGTLLLLPCRSGMCCLR
jgi:hypothetical protein